MAPGDGSRDGVRRFWSAIEGPVSYALGHPERVHGIEEFLQGHIERFGNEAPGFPAGLSARLVALADGLDEATADRRKKRLQDLADAVGSVLSGQAPLVGDAVAIPSPVSSPPEPVFNAAPALASDPTTHSTTDKTAEPSGGSALNLSTPIQYVKGVGPARASQLERLGIFTVGDALEHLPRRYEDRRELRPISLLRPNQVETVAGVVVSSSLHTTPRRRMKIFEAVVDDGRGRITAKWFNQAYLKKTLKAGTRVVMTGLVKPGYRRSVPEMENPEYEIVSEDEPHIHASRIVPVYPLTEGWSARGMRKLLYRLAVESPASLVDCLPDDLKRRQGLVSIEDAMRNIHFPPSEADVEMLNNHRDPWRRRLAFEELFILEVGLARLRAGALEVDGIAFNPRSPRLDKLIATLPFALTSAQKRVIGEIRDDMSANRPMNRLVQGDVGCGKTLVALAAMLTAVDSGYQAALMAPTEILAEQHYLNIRLLAETLGVKAGFFSSGSKKTGTPEDLDLVVGTHALIQQQMGFRKLGLAVIDEQHRFGVSQRAALRAKGNNPDVLVMTATPIPRTLCLTLYGDLDVSVIDEMPPGRTPVDTAIAMPSQRDAVFAQVLEEVKRGRQAYVVFPLVEESETMDLKSATQGFEELHARFPGRTVGLLHGKMNPDAKTAVMEEFKAGVVDVLVATTVIEVGVDVPNASIMVIEHAERFGLSQLHQLRGRVGRGSSRSRCILVAYPPLTDEGRRRLRVMEETADGFRIAEADLDIRGPGEFFGTRQSGMPDLRVAHLVRDLDLLETARREAFALVERDPELQSVPPLRDALERRWPERLKNIRAG